MYITVLYMLLLKGHLCIPADFPFGCFFTSTNLCLDWFLLICMSKCVKATTSVTYILPILHKYFSPE